MKLPPPAIVMTVERGKDMDFRFEQAVWGYGEYNLYTEEQVRYILNGAAAGQQPVEPRHA